MLTRLLTWLNAGANRLADVLLAPIAWLPGWLSATIIAVLTGIVMLVVFKHTSRQASIKLARNRIKANLLAISLFQDDVRVALRCQGNLLLAASKLLSLSVVPMLVMLLPTCLLLGQLALWYQARPLAVGEEAVVTVYVAAGNRAAREVKLVRATGVTPGVGPVRVPSKQMVCWSVTATEPGLNELAFEIDGTTVSKQIAVGSGFMPTSPRRPQWSLSDVLLHPREPPFAPDSPVQAIEVAFPRREAWTSGSDSWLIYWFLVSLAAAFAARPLLGVNL